MDQVFLCHFLYFHNIISLTLTTLWANSADDKLKISFLFFPENRISPMETICLKCLILFSGKNKKKKKNFNVSCAENFSHSAKH